MSTIRTLSRLAFAGTLTLAGFSAVANAPSGASPSSAGVAHTGRVLYPTVAQAALNRAQGAAGTNSSTSTFALSAHGGLNGTEVTTGTPKVYLVFYGSQWGTASVDSSGIYSFSNDPSEMALYLQKLLNGIGTNGETWSGVMTQYCNGEASGTTTCTTGEHAGYPTGGALAGVWYDNSSASPTKASGYQLAAEAVAAAGYFKNTTQSSNDSAQYVIVSPTGLHPDGFNTRNTNWCAWHDYNGDTTLSGGAAPSIYGNIAFTNLPYLPDMGTSCGANFVNGSAGALDGVSIVEGHEYAETLTDQYPGYGYYDNSSGMENGDKCAWISSGSGAAQDVTFTTGSFAMQSTWSNADNACMISDPVQTGAVANDFSITANPTSASVVAGTSATATIATATTSGASQTVALTATGQPTGVSASFSPSSITPGVNSTLTLTAASSTPSGTYTVTITGTGASATHSTTFTLTVTPSGTFSLRLTPTLGTLSAGGSTSTQVTTALTTSAAPSVNLTVSGLPSGVSATFNPSTITVGNSSTLTFSAMKRLHKGSATITVTATGGGSSASAQYTLTY